MEKERASEISVIDVEGKGINNKIAVYDKVNLFDLIRTSCFCCSDSIK